MKEQMPTHDAPQKKGGVTDQRQQQTGAAGKPRRDLNESRENRSQKQPGQDLRDPQKGADDGK